MPQYEKYTTTVVGAHSVPRWYEALHVVLGKLKAMSAAKAILRGGQGS